MDLARLELRRAGRPVDVPARAIEPDPERPSHLLTVHGRGYRLVTRA